MVVKDRYVSKFIPKYQNSGMAVISGRKNVLPNVVTNYTRQLCAEYSTKFGSITKLYSLICTSLCFSHSAEG